MSIENYKRTFRRIPEEIFNNGNIAAADQVMTADYIEHISLPPGYTPDRAGFVKFVAMWRQAVPDLHYTVTHFTESDLIGEGDRVVHRVVGRGTHRGEFLGIPPTGKRLQWSEIHIGRFAGGKLVEHWGQIDVLAILQQLGIVPGGSEAKPPDPVAPAVLFGPTTTSEENKALTRRFIEEVWNRGRLDMADELFHPRATSPSAAGLPAGPAGVKMVAAVFRAAFPDFHMTIDDLIAEDAFVVGRFTEAGTHMGPLFGIPASGKRVSFGEIGILRFAGRQVVESWYETDMAGLFQQLGVGSQVQARS